MATIAAERQRRWGTFSNPAHLLYAILLVESLVSGFLAFAFGFRAASLWSFAPQLYCVLLVLSGPLARRINYPRLGGSCETVGLLYGQGFALFALLYPLTAIAAPFADAQLAASDRMLGFDWPAFAHAVKDHVTILRIMKAVYFSFSWQAALILPSLFFSGHTRRAWITIVAANFALLMTLLLYPCAPAAGTFIHYGISPAKYPNMSAQVAWVFGPAIHAIRDGGARLITKDLMVPFVSFPSYHAVAALLFAWSAWPIRWLRWPAVVFNLAMTISALIIGAHYLVDVLAGLAIGLAAIPTAAAALRLTCSNQFLTSITPNSSA